VLLQAKLVPTPFGARPEICVTRGVPSGSHIEEVEDGVLIHHPTGEKQKLPKHQECIDFHANWMQTKRNRTAAQKEKVGSALNGWLDYVGWYPPASDEVVSFTGDYLVPPNPATDGSQVLFYFIGTQNNGGADVTILQPVLTWGNGINGWSFASWNCCPAGQQQESTPIQGFGAGDTVSGSIQASGTNWVITSTASGKSTVLTVADASRDFDWVDVTLEVYNVEGCAEFPNGPMVFSNMVLTIANAGAVNAQWQADSGPTECDGSLVVNSPSMVTITHS
jgi:hypothetical protein